MAKRKLALKRETLIELSCADLEAVVAAADTTTVVDKVWDKFSLPTCEGCTPLLRR